MSQIVIPSFASFTPTWHSAPYESISPLRPELSASGRSVVVTGGGTGIGKAIAKAFAQAGASSIAILGRREDRLKAAVEEISLMAGKGNTSVLYRTVDLTKRDEIKKALEAVVVEQGSNIDIFVSNAGALADPGPAIAFAEEEFMRTFDYNIRIPLNSVHAFLPHAADEAILLNISSGIAHMKPVPGLSAHGTGKAAALKLFDYIQAENPGLHIVNVQPGSVDTEMTKKAGTKGRDDVNLPAHFCVWLASKEAEFLKGKFVWSNWDVDEMKKSADEVQSTQLLSVTLQGVPM